MKIVITEKELKKRYPGASNPDIQRCFLECKEKPLPGSQPRIKGASVTVQIREFDQDTEVSHRLTALKSSSKTDFIEKEFHQWASYAVAIENHTRFEEFKDRFEWYIAGWVDFFDKILWPLEKDYGKYKDHELIFEWGPIDSKSKKYLVFILISPFEGRPYSPQPPKQ